MGSANVRVLLEGPAGMIRCIQGQKDFKAKLSVSTPWILGKANPRTILAQTPFS